jgi:hypothetical protein
MKKSSLFRNRVSQASLESFEWEMLTEEVRDLMPTFAALLLDSLLPSTEEVRHQYHRGRRQSTRRPLSVDEANTRLSQRVALIMGVLMATIHPRTHTFVQQLMSAWLWIGNAKSSVCLCCFFCVL